MRPTIGIVMIVKNEEVMLARCLESVKEADEIIICDTGSKDRTIEIARKYTDKVFTDFQWCDDFAKARNHAKSKSTTDWILSIDADEYLQSSFQEVVDAVSNAGSRIALNICQNGEDGNQRNYFPRLFRNIPEVFWVGRAHNHLNVAPGDVICNVSIVYGRSPAHDLDPDRTMRILEDEVGKNPEAVREMFYLGREYFYRDRYSETIKMLVRYLRKSEHVAEQAEALMIISRSFWAMGKGEEARQACISALLINPHFKEAAFFMADLSGHGTGNPRWERNARQWRRLAETADNDNVLFVRDIYPVLA